MPWRFQMKPTVMYWEYNVLCRSIWAYFFPYIIKRFILFAYWFFVVIYFPPLFLEAFDDWKEEVLFFRSKPQRPCHQQPSNTFDLLECKSLPLLWYGVKSNFTRKTRKIFSLLLLLLLQYPGQQNIYWTCSLHKSCIFNNFPKLPGTAACIAQK